MKQIATYIIAAAAMLYIAQFVWGFKTAKDDAEAARYARAQQTITDTFNGIE